MSTSPTGIEADRLYYVRTVCPSCEQPDIVMVHLGAILTTTVSEAFLSVKAAPKKVEHTCGQTSLLGAAESERAESEPADGETLALPYVDHESGEIVHGLADDDDLIDAEILDGDGL